ncbi:MAG: DUF5018 domain-containing protein [Paludibacteraceae bacterium]|nr:DUF5018 domain-containing protein [Paludibacteraceae bacterium]
MKKTLLKLSIFALGLLTSVGALAASTEIFKWTPTSSEPTAATGGTVTTSTDAAWNDSKAGIKLGSTKAYAVLQLTSGTFEEGDVITVTMQNTGHQAGVFLYNESATEYKYGNAPLVTSSGSGTLTATFDGAGKIVIARGSGTTMYLQNLVIERPIKAPALNAFTLNGINGTIDQAAGTVTIELPYGSTEPSDAEILAACTVNSAATEPTTYDAATHTITVTDGTTPKEYVLTVTISATASTDATLKSLSVGGTAVTGFAADKLSYDIEVPYGTAAQPAITFEANDATATPVLTNADWTSETKTATVDVTAQDGTTTLTYTINFTIADLKRTLTSIAFSNGVGGYIINDEAVMVTSGTPHTITVPYIGDKPTVTAATFGETETSGKMSIDGNTYSLTSTLDAGVSQQDYAVTYRELTPANIALNTTYNFSADDASAAWIHTVYGYDASKGLRYSKTTNTDKPRSTEGTTRIVFAIPAGVTKVTLNSTGTNRAIKITSSAGTVEKSAANSYEVEIDGTEASLLIVESNQTGGDGGFASIVLSDGSPVLSNECDITSFTIAGVAATISGANITAELPAGTDVTALTPSIVTSTGATVDPTTAQDFSSAVEYTVTAEDGVTTKKYTVTITVAAPATGVEEAEAEVVKTYYISADGKTYNAAVKGLPLIKVEELSNGTIKTSKVMIED